MRSWANLLYIALALAISGLCLYNVVSDNAAVETMARAAVPGCEDQKCALARLDRTPLAQEFQFSLRGGQSAAVRCQRQAILVGAYSCARR